MEKILVTDRIRLRLVSSQDLAAVHELHSLPETDEYNTLGIPDTIDQTRAVLQGWINAAKKETSPEFTFTIEDINTNSFIGLIAIKCGNPKFKIAEVWYKLHVMHWRKGYGFEALRAVLTYGFDTLQLHRIEAGCAVENTASIALLKKAGMLEEGRKRKVLPLKKGWSDNIEFAILEEDWIKNQQSSPLFQHS